MVRNRILSFANYVKIIQLYGNSNPILPNRYKKYIHTTKSTFLKMNWLHPYTPKHRVNAKAARTLILDICQTNNPLSIVFDGCVSALAKSFIESGIPKPFFDFLAYIVGH